MYRSPSTPGPSKSALRTPAAATSGSSSVGGNGPVVALVVLVAIYVAWAYIAAHESIRSSIQPKNIAINIWNMMVIGYTVIVTLVLFKIVITKLAAWGVPGFDHLATVVASA